MINDYCNRTSVNTDEPIGDSLPDALVKAGPPSPGTDTVKVVGNEDVGYSLPAQINVVLFS